MRRIFVFSLMILLLMQSAMIVAAQEETLSPTCAYIKENSIIFRYEYRNRRIVLVNGKTNEVIKELEISLETPSFRTESLSPDCRYMVGRIPGTYIVWDITTNARMGTFEAHTPNTRLWWDERSQYLIVPVSHDGTYLWQIAADNKLKLNANPCGFRAIEWDYDRNQLLGITGSSINGAWCSYTIDSRIVDAYDLSNGTLLAQYPATGPGYESAFGTFANRRYIVAVNYNVGPASVWDRDTGQVQVVNIGFDRGVSHLGFELSLDSRYLITMTRRNIEVWDLHNLAPKLEDHEPTWVMTGFNRPSVRHVGFVDNTIIEAVYRDDTVRRWNVATGEEITG